MTNASTGSARATARRGSALLKLSLALAAFTAIAVGTLIATFSRSDDAAAPAAALHDVAKTSFDVILTCNGDLDAKNRTVLRSELETRSSIVEVVDEGTRVEEGALLVRLSDDELQKQLDNEMLSLESARSDLVSASNSLEIQISDNESQLNKAQLRLELAELEMKKWLEGDDKEKRRELALDIDAAEREEERLREKYERSQDLHAENFLSSDELKQDELAAIKAQSNLEKARLREWVYETYERPMQLKKKQSEIDEATAELDRVKRRNESELASKQAAVTNRQRQLALREERVEKLQQQIEACTITAPTDGLVVYATSLRRNRWNDDGPLEVGTEVRPNEELIVLPNNEEMVAKVNIHESLVGQVEKGQHARVRIDAARGQNFDGTVESVGVIAESGGWRDPNLREYQVQILLHADARKHALKPSMRCEAEIIVDRVDDAIAVPIQAVFQEGKVSYVHRPRAGRFERVPVGVGRRSESLIEIVAGLDVGDVVLLRKPKPGEILPGTFDEETIANLAAQARAAQKARNDEKPDDQPTTRAQNPRRGAAG